MLTVVPSSVICELPIAVPLGVNFEIVFTVPFTAAEVPDFSEYKAYGTLNN